MVQTTTMSWFIPVCCWLHITCLIADTILLDVTHMHATWEWHWDLCNEVIEICDKNLTTKIATGWKLSNTQTNNWTANTFRIGKSLYLSIDYWLSRWRSSWWVSRLLDISIDYWLSRWRSSWWVSRLLDLSIDYLKFLLELLSLSLVKRCTIMVIITHTTITWLLIVGVLDMWSTLTVFSQPAEVVTSYVYQNKHSWLGQN